MPKKGAPGKGRKLEGGRVERPIPYDPGKGRHSMKRPRWDILHPGRPWAKLLKPAESPEEITADLLQRGAP